MKYILLGIALIFHPGTSLQSSTMLQGKGAGKYIRFSHQKVEQHRTQRECKIGNITFPLGIRVNQHDELLWPLVPADSRSRCALHNTVTRNPDMLRVFLQLWHDSKPDSAISQRTEKGGWIIINEKKEYQFIPFPSKWKATVCSIEFPMTLVEELPEGLVGVVHTHPFFAGEDTTPGSVCGDKIGGQYKSGVSYEDLFLLVKIAEHLSDYCIKSFIIDGDHVITLSAWGTMDFYPTDTFFSL